jgi:hypothetical protein
MCIWGRIHNALSYLLLINGLNKLEGSPLAGFSSIVCLWVRPGACSRVEHWKVASLGSALALLTNIRLGWKGLPGTNTLTYLSHL